MNFKRQPRIKNYHSCYCNEGHWHQSRGEAAYCNQLYLLKKAGEIINVEQQIQYSLDVNGKHITNIRPDFRVTLNDGSETIHEYKGMETQIWQIKKKLFEALYPEIPYIVKTRKDLF